MFVVTFFLGMEALLALTHIGATHTNEGWERRRGTGLTLVFSWFTGDGRLRATGAGAAVAGTRVAIADTLIVLGPKGSC